MSDIEPREFLIAYLVFLLSTTLHEFGHAKVGDRFGSRFAADAGLVTLNPLVHMKRSPFGMVMMPIVGVLFFGWLWPVGWASVPYDPLWGARNPSKKAWMSLSGPLGNVLLAVVALGLAKALLIAGMLVVPENPTLQHVLQAANGDSNSPAGVLAYGLGVMMFMNIGLAIFNLLPVPPLDGAGVVEGFWPHQTRVLFDKLREVPMISMIIFFVAFSYAWKLIRPVQVWAAQMLM
ncbi:MAG: site-2 protease family protein [Deltaproteobacteria bacterium]|nr:site-2 protease family protein [Deltaproteobacteria bacterium]